MGTRMQHGFEAPVGLTVSCCWSYDHDTRRRVGQRKGVSLAGSHARRDGWMQLTAEAREIVAILSLSYAARLRRILLPRLFGITSKET